MPPRKKKPAAGSVGLAADELATGATSPALDRVRATVEAVGGTVLAAYRDPFAGHPLLLAALPIDKVAPTPFQRELSDTHVGRLGEVIPKVGRFLDPLVAVATEDEAGFVTPNGMHRLEAMRRLGAKAIVALVVPEREIAYRILALNTEKAHNLKDKALEVVRMADALAEDPDAGAKIESTWAFEFEEPAYLTIGRVYQARPRYAGGAYLPVVKRCEAFADEPIADMVEIRRARAEKLAALDDAVAGAVAALKEKGLTSPYLKPFVVARINPLRFAKKTDTPADFDATIDKMLDKASTLDPDKIKQTDLAGAYGSPAAD
jgi:ParB family chromosome partitioning protein